MSREYDDHLRRDIAAQLADLTYLASMPAPNWSDFIATAATFLEGRSPAAFVLDRRQRAVEAMQIARAQRIKREIPAAIRSAYDSDFQTLEAYLVESAMVTGDLALISVQIRGDLVAGAMAELPGLPEDFARAVDTIRETLCSALNEADGERLRGLFSPL
jgi:hypothetical protein